MAQRRKQIEEQRHYTKVGRLRKPIANAIGREAADIYLSDNYKKHVFLRHEEDIKSVGLTPIVFLEMVINGFNRIYKGSGNSLLLVLFNGKPKVTVIEINMAFKDVFYEVKTATVMNKSFFTKKKIIWEK
jgi:hypothetical protein